MQAMFWFTYRCVNECYAGSKVRIRFDFVDKSVLAPITGHKSQAHGSERNQINKDGCASVDVVVHEVQEDVVADLTSACLECKVGLTRVQKVHGQVKPDEEVESADILHKVPDAVSLVSNRGRKVVRTIAFDVVVLDMVVVV